MNLDKLKSKLESFFELDNTGHDIHHALRVLYLAEKLQKSHGGNIDVIQISALVHDMYRPWEKRTGKSHFSEEALDMIQKFLLELAIRSNTIEQVIDVVRYHDVYDDERIPDKSIELQIIQDADNLDAMGAIGIARTFMFGGAYGLPMYIPGENLEFDKPFEDTPTHKTSTVAHFYEKLLKLRDQMNTNKGKEIAEKRHKFMEKFLKEFFNEWPNHTK
jgi:uncharacterized protein